MKQFSYKPKLILNENKHTKYILSTNNNLKQPFKLKHNNRATEIPTIISSSGNSHNNQRLSLKKQNTLSTTKSLNLHKDKKDSSRLPKIQTNNFEFVDPLELSFGNERNIKTFHKMKTHVPSQNNSNKRQTVPQTKENYNFGQIQTTEYTDNMNHTNENANTINTEANQVVNKEIQLPSYKQFQKINTVTHKSRKHNFLFHKKFPTVKHSSYQIGSYIKSFAVNSFTGSKKQNNDEKVSIILSIAKPKDYISLTTPWPNCSFIAIYEGFEGNECSNFLRDNLHNYIIKNEYFPKNPEKAITNAFVQAQFDYINQNNQKTLNPNCGSFALVGIVINEYLYIANCGRCQGVISYKNGSDIKTISKQDNNACFGGNDNQIKCVPEIKRIKLTQNKQIDFILFGTTGLFEQMESREVCNLTWNCLNTMLYKYESFHSFSGGIVDHLIKKAIKMGSENNITCLFLGFENFEKKFNSGEVTNEFRKRNIDIMDTPLKLSYRNFGEHNKKKIILKAKIIENTKENQSSEDE